MYVRMFFFFFFQAEDGIRDYKVTGVQTCALPISVWVSADVSESYIRFIQLQEKVGISLVAYPGEAFEGHVSRIADTVNPQTRTVKVQAEIQNPRGRLRPEMFGSVHHVASMKVMPVLPPAAVIQNGGASIVFFGGEPRRLKKTEGTVGGRTGEWVSRI